MGRVKTSVGVAVALLLLGIGINLNQADVASAGSYLLPLVLFGGGLLSTEESAPVRVTMLVFGGLLLIILAARGLF